MTKRKSKSRSGKLSAHQLRAEIKRFFKRNQKKQYNPKQIIKKLKLKNSKDAVQDALDRLAKEGLVVALGDYKYKAGAKVKEASRGPRPTDKLLEGRVDMTRSGAAYIIIDGQEEDIFVGERYLNTAMHGDRVKIRSWRPRGRRKPEGEVMEIVKRATEHFVGTVGQYAEFAVVSTDGKRPVEIIVDPNDLLGAEEGEKVVVKIVEWTTGRFQNPLGKVTAVLGQPGTSDIEMQAILINNGFQISFPEEVMAQAGQLPTEISEQEIALRKDFREIPTFTIDPDDAKDFDDAISLRQLENGRLEIGVHIADVTHYVRPKTALDKEAFDRSTSVYLVDRVCPMLPEQISNVLCSLRPHEDKLTFSAVFELDEKYQVRKRWFGKTVIHSDRRFTYNEAQERIEGKPGDFMDELQLLNTIAKKLRERRYKNGAIDFDSEEVRFRLDEDGAPIDVYVKERKDAHMLVEDFMLLANREVASYIRRKEDSRQINIPFVYRVHDEPDPDKVAELALFAKAMGLQLDISNPRAIARSYNRIVKAGEKEPGLKMLGPIAIRTMAKAIYTTENIGHYGLGFDNYAHFTSPIRRYADVLVHRILEKNLGRGLYVEKKGELEEQAGHISRQERHAADAERESVKYKQVEYMEKHVGETFPGIINGIADFGVFIELTESHAEGMIPFEYMDDSYFISDNKLSIEARRTRKVLRMGDPLMVKIMEADLRTRKITMAFVEALPRPAVVIEPEVKPKTNKTGRRSQGQGRRQGPAKRKKRK